VSVDALYRPVTLHTKGASVYCSEWSLLKVEFRTATVLPLKCKCWTCDECRPGRTRRLVEEAKSGRPTIFITLTSRRRPGLTRDQAAVNMTDAWRKVRRKYMATHGRGSIPFLAVFEETKKGWPHLHIVVRAKWVKQRWLSKQMRKLTGSPIVWVTKVHGLGKVAAYISKYISKNPHRFAGVKRYWRSLDYLEAPADDDDDPWHEVPWWQVVQRFWVFLAEDLEAAGWRVNTGRVLAPP